MADRYLKKYVKKCAQELARRHDENPKWFHYESDFHSELYFLLNYVNQKFWETSNVEMGTKSNFHGNDIFICNPYDETQEAYIEIKYFDNKGPIKSDLDKLTGVPGEKIFIYFGDKDDKKTKKSTLVNLRRKRKYCKINIFYAPFRKEFEEL
jgi:hypothetical protein